MTDVVHQIKQEGRKFWFVKRQGNSLTSWHTNWRHLKRAFFENGVCAANVYWDRKALLFDQVADYSVKEIEEKISRWKN